MARFRFKMGPLIMEVWVSGERSSCFSSSFPSLALSAAGAGAGFGEEVFMAAVGEAGAGVSAVEAVLEASAAADRAAVDPAAVGKNQR